MNGFNRFYFDGWESDNIDFIMPFHTEIENDLNNGKLDFAYFQNRMTSCQRPFTLLSKFSNQTNEKLIQHGFGLENFHKDFVTYYCEKYPFHIIDNFRRNKYFPPGLLLFLRNTVQSLPDDQLNPDEKTSILKRIETILPEYADEARVWSRLVFQLISHDNPQDQLLIHGRPNTNQK